MTLITFISTLLVFALIVLASSRIGAVATRYNLPLITGYLLTGMLVGPFLLDILHAEQTITLRFMEQLSLAVIAFAAGAELRIKDIRSEVGAIGWNTLAQTVITFTGGVVGVLLLARFIPFMADMSGVEHLAVALLAATILVARSPSSAIAIINELRAKGPFTKITLGVTVIKDVLIIVIFALNVQIADAIFTGAGFSFASLLTILGSILASFLIGYVLAKGFDGLSALKVPRWGKIASMLIAGYGIFAFSDWLRAYTHTHLPNEILLEPLIMCMSAGFILVNYSANHREFSALLEDIGPTIYLIFFTLVGAELQLDVLLAIWPITLALFSIRLVSLVLASLAGGTLAGQNRDFRVLSWMAFVTQAGVGLGLAQEIASEFPELGTSFSTILISVIVLSQLVGPPLMKFAIRRVGESNEPDHLRPDGMVRRALIIGREGVSLALARNLQGHDWQVTMADSQNNHISVPDGIPCQQLDDLSEAALRPLMQPVPDALIALLPDEEQNLAVCAVAYKLGVNSIITRLHDASQRDAFREIDVHVVEPTTALVNVLSELVISPQTRVLLDRHEIDIRQITVTDPDVHNRLLKDVYLPEDVLCLSILRDGQSIVPHGYTLLKTGDELAVLGSADSLTAVTVRLGR